MRFSTCNPSRKLLSAFLTVAVAALVFIGRSRTQHVRGIAIGAYITDGPFEAPCDAAAIDKFAHLVGRMPAVVLSFQLWGARAHDFPKQCMGNVIARGAAPMLTWEPWAGAITDPTYKLSNIVRGDFDSYIRRYAQGAKAWGHPFLLRFAHEMNGNWYPWGTMAGAPNRNSPSDYVAAWRHVHDIFDQVGASNVRWVWSPNVMGYVGDTPSPSYASLYPGDAYVDWVGLDGYNSGTSQAGSGTSQTGLGWRSLEDLFAPSYKAMTSLTSKPLMIAETASSERGGSKAAWITHGFLHALPTRLPRVQVVVWFDKPKEADWSVTSSSSSLQAYRTVVANASNEGHIDVASNATTTPRP